MEIFTASTGEEGLGTALREEPDVVLMDIGLPDRSGLAVGRDIIEKLPDVRVVALTALGDATAVRESLRAGFHAYITKDTSVSEFLSSLRAVLEGQVVITRKLAPSVGGAHDEQQRSAHLLTSQLTPREREVLSLLVDGATGSEIAKRLSISANTVRTHIQGILTKLQVHSRLEAAAFAVRNGLVDVPQRAYR